MKAIVTGGCGFIGSHLTERLIQEGWEVRVIDNLSSGRLDNLNPVKNHPRMHVILADIADAKTMQDLSESESVRDVEYIFHLAALADIVPSIVEPEKYFQSNVHGTFRVLELARKLPLKKFIYAASSSCYGIPDIYPTPENAEIRPQYPYALTKYLGEEMVLHWHQVYQVPANSLRFFNVYGPRSRTSGTYGAVFGVFLAQKIHGKPYTVVGDGTQTRDFTFVTDVIDACFKAALSDLQGEVMNVGSGHHYSINRLVELLGGEVTYIPKRPGEPDCTFADIRKIREKLNWTPRVSFEAGVRTMLEHIDYWKEAPVWTPDTIRDATKDWFKYLKK